MVISFAVAGVWFALFLFSFLRDRRLLRNGVYLVLTLSFAGLGVIFALESVSDTAARLLVIAVLIAIPVAIFVLAVFLVANGVQMLRREGRRSPLLLTSGGQGPGEDVPESHAMADYLITNGVPADQIRREDRSTSTYENLAFSRAIMLDHNPKYRCLVVTNNFHALRAAFTARKAPSSA